MRLSNKSTFSLASLIVLLVLGCMFVVTSVMAHAPGSDERAHDHPLLEALPALDGNDDDDTDDPGEAAVAVHGAHPTTTIALKSGQSNVSGTTVAVVADDADTADVQENTFVLLVTFNVDVTNSATQTSIADDFNNIANGDLADSEFTFSLVGINNIATTNAPTLTIVRVNDGADTPAIVAAGKKQFEVTVAITDVPSGTADANDETLTFRIRVNAGGVFALQETLIGTNGITPVDVPGGGNLASDILTLTLVDALDAPPDNMVPVVTVTADDTTSTATSAVFNITSNDPDSSDALTFDITKVSASDGTVSIVPTTDGYTATVTHDGGPVTLTVAAGAVTDSDGGMSAEASETYTFTPTADTTDPTVTITAAAGTGGNVIFTFTFSEALGSGANAFTLDDIDRANSNAQFIGQPVMDTTDPKVYTLEVGNPNDVDPLIIVLKTLSVADMSGNTLKGDQTGVYRKTPIVPEGDKPVVTVALAGGMTYIDSVDGGNVMITATDNVAVTNAVMAAEVTVTGGSKGAAISNGMLMVTPNVAATSVTVAVAAGAAMDAAGNGSDAVSMTFNVGPIFTVPAGAGTSNPGYLVITKTAGMTHSYLSDQPTIHTSPQQTNPPTPAANLNVATWGNMPDLERLFNTGSGNGGTLNIKKAATHPKNADGTDVGTGGVKITEVMWAIDESKRGALNDAEADDQWVEIENPNGHAVHVIIYARTGLDSAVTHNEAKIDRIGNAYNGGPGSGQWGVPGDNGNSYTGTDFVSMWRRYVENNRGKGYQNGTSSGAWAASGNIYLTSQTGNPNDGALYNHKGTPGRLQSVDLPNPSTRAGRTNPPSSPFVINEVANRDSGNARYEWIEIKNVTGTTQNLRNYLISVVTATDHDNVLVELDNRDYNIPAGRVVLLLTSNPRYDDDHPIAVGYNMDIGPPSDQVDGLGLIVEGSNRQPPLQIVQPFKRELPNDNNGRSYVLILRRPDNYEGHRSGAHGGKGVAETGEADVDKIVDIAGHHESLNKSNYPKTTPENLNNTTLWPLVNFSGHNRPHRGHGDWNHRRHNALEMNRVRYRQHVKTSARNDADGSDGVNRGGTGATHKNEDVGHYAFRDANYTGLGYKRTARITGVHNGTPGYDGNTIKPNDFDVKSTAGNVSVSISEIMASTGRDADNPVLPQWIELYNSSPTEAVNLQNWKLRFEMLNADGTPMDSLMTLDLNKGRVKTIAPQQTVLIVAGNARQANSDAAAGTDVFNENRVFNVFRDYGGANKFGANTRYMFFNPKAFHMALLDRDNNVVDAVGNLDGDARTSDTNTWEYPEGVAMDGNRTSFIRVYDAGKARDAVNTGESNVMPVFGTGDGKKTDTDGIDAKWAWIPAVNTEREFKVTIRSTWYGVEDDYGTPNNRPGMVLPVELSFFRPTLEDGVVTVRWTTESELDNAGFNILRSDTRNGEYTQVNAEMIQGAGTTGERSSYKWVDPTAKPGVVYYYQIEDVSFAGERQALAITKLKGLISAENKLTTTWSELKASQ